MNFDELFFSEQELGRPRWYHGLMPGITLNEQACILCNARIGAISRLMINFFWSVKPSIRENKKRRRFLQAFSTITPSSLIYSNMFIRHWYMIKTNGSNYFIKKEIKEQKRTPFENLFVFISKRVAYVSYAGIWQLYATASR